jgi:hypothetical protein
VADRGQTMTYKMRVTEAALLLDAIFRRPAREKSTRLRHPVSTELFWVRHSLAPARVESQIQEDTAG